MAFERSFDAALSKAQPAEDLVAVGGDLQPARVLAAYRTGLFPMGLGRHGRGPLGWWSPDPRGILPVEGMHISRSLRAAQRRYEIRIDTCFDEVVIACADPRRPGRWITNDVRRAYARLHRLGWAHSIEAWQDGELAGGLYGVSINGLFAGESMFHRRRDASKVALAGLVDHLRRSSDTSEQDLLIDVQWQTAHLQSLGVIEISRQVYLDRLADALTMAPSAWPLRPPSALPPSEAELPLFDAE